MTLKNELKQGLPQFIQEIENYYYMLNDLIINREIKKVSFEYPMITLIMTQLTNLIIFLKQLNNMLM